MSKFKEIGNNTNIKSNTNIPKFSQIIERKNSQLLPLISKK